MKKQATILLCFIVTIWLAACNLPIVLDPADGSEEIAEQYQAVSVLLTSTAAAKLNPAPPAEPTAVQPPVVSPTSQPTAAPVPEASATNPTRVAGESLQKAAGPACDQAQAGIPIDITIPDDTRLVPGEAFAKTWRLVNAGSCRWTRDYSVVWFSGDELGFSRAQSFSASVEPGRTVDVTVDMVAPRQPGTYQSNWKLRSEDGHLFGIGPNGDAPFWVRIVVVPVSTPTATATIPIVTPTSAPLILVRGSMEMLLDEQLDLDMEDVEPVQHDLVLLTAGEAQELLILAPQNGTRLALFGANPPRFEECLAAGPDLNGDDLLLEPGMANNYYCYQTSEGLPGRLLLTRVEPDRLQLRLEYTTWAAP